MLNVLKRLSLGIVLIVLAAAVLLFSDWSRRATKGAGILRIGLLQHASTVLLDDGTRGMVDALAAKGFVEGKTIIIDRYNSEGDIAVANSIAKQMVNSQYDLLLTCSTISLQAVAPANRGRKTVQVFGLSADPPGAGVGISRENPLQHPPNLVGCGSFLPAGESFRIAKRLYPGLQTVGVAWNPAESNSRAFTESARDACGPLGIELLEATVENSNGVLESVNSLISRGAEAIWVGGDVTVSVAIDSVVSSARKARIPVFTITPGKPDRGTLFDYGADFYLIGRQTGELAARVLHGANPKEIPVTNFVPRWLVVNKTALRDLKDPWQLSDDLLRKADVVVDDAGIHARKPGPGAGPEEK